MYPRVKNVKARENYLLEIKFTNNSCRIFDVKPYLNFGVFKELKDTKYFNKVNCSGNSIAWPNGQDICPDTLFIESIPRFGKGKDKTPYTSEEWKKIEYLASKKGKIFKSVKALQKHLHSL
jgi:hypothetical protein